MTNFTDELAEATHKQLWQEAKQKYETLFRVPKEEASRISEIVRALHVLKYWQSRGRLGSPIAELKAHSVLPDIVDYVAKTYLGEKYIKQEEKAKAEKEPKRKDKWGAFIEWANENEGKKFTTEQLEKKSGFSYQTTLTYVKTSPVFEKIKKGQYRVIPLHERVRKS